MVLLPLFMVGSNVWVGKAITFEATIRVAKFNLQFAVVR
jgi:hypothetical protein